MPYFRRWPVDEDPHELLDPANQVSTPWGDHDHGPCDKCGGGGHVRHRCSSCIEGGADADCPACGGRVEYEDVCPACEGSGTIDRTEREGVSVFPSLAGLCRYLAERDVDVSGCTAVVLDGDLTGDRDLDADAGALLIRPRRVLGMCPLE